MKRTYRKSQKESSGRRVHIVERTEALSGRVAVELPISLAEVIDGLSEEIERLAGEAGLRLMDAVLNAEVDSLAGRRGRHDADRQVYRWGSQGGYAVLAGKKISLRRPRVRDREGREVALESYSRFQSPPRLSRPRAAGRHRPLGRSKGQEGGSRSPHHDLGCGVAGPAPCSPLPSVTSSSPPALLH